MPVHWVTTLLARLLLGLAFLLYGFFAYAAEVGDTVQLIEREIGIPGHPDPGNRSVSHRFPSGITVNVNAIDTTTDWLHVEDADTNAAWITPRYINHVVPAQPPAIPTGQCYRVGTWNLEHFHAGVGRGFPENTRGGPSYPARSENDINAIATVIRDTLNIKILILNEIMGEERMVEGETQYRSDELDQLIQALGSSYEYVIAASGQSQRIALLYDTSHIHLNAVLEMAVDRIEVQGSDIFARDPLLGYFSFLHNGVRRNDLVVIGLHLASGQHKTDNHDQAMSLLRQRLGQLRGQSIVLPANEHDIVIGGDLNASNYDNRTEQFFQDFNQGTWSLLAGNVYPATRLGDIQAGAGFQLGPKSYLDYLIVSRQTGTVDGLMGDEISQATADVHQELANGQWDMFRRVFSDHFPVTTCVSIRSDND
jgi:endonuclease/exonuclease/phosphatase family metal-dependent hydrolase